MLETSARRDQAAHDYVLFEASEVVDLAGDRGFCQNASRFLEARRRDKRIGRERGLGDAQEQRTARCRAAAILDHLVVLLAEAELVHLLFKEERGVAHVFDLDPA